MIGIQRFAVDIGFVPPHLVTHTFAQLSRHASGGAARAEDIDITLGSVK